jgi:hypothetical protein
VSTILKALRRLEEEKTAPVGRRPLREEVTRNAGAPRSRRGAWLLALGGLVGGVAAGVALLTLWPRDVAVQPSSPPLVRAPSRPPQVAPPEREVSPGQLSAEALASPVEVVERPKPRPLVVHEPLPAVAAELERSSAQRDPAASRPAPSVASPPPAAVSTAAQEAPPTGLSTGSREATYAELEEIGRRLAEISPPVAAGIRIEQTLWHPRPDRRVAVLTLDGGDVPVRVHEGDTIRELVVSEIEPSGVVFTYRGEPSRLGLGEAP